MRLQPNAHLGPYQVITFLGAGGMGEVYRARDTRLGRTVAIKVLPHDVAADSDERVRFEREARAISSLSHPNICALFDIGHHEGVDFLVMEHLEGETLAARLSRGPLPLDQVLRHSIEIADALDKAHRHGIIHRDLKPGNIMLTAGGAKLLDFGLAKLQATVMSEGALATTTFTPNPSVTGEGKILGSLNYMAPEQLEGRSVDSRADIFGFGAVVYEMTTGKKAFEARSQASVIAAIISSIPPPMPSVRPIVPQALDRVIATCLAKNPDERWQSGRDLVHVLRWLERGDIHAVLTAGRAETDRRIRKVLWAVAASFAVLSAAALPSAIRHYRERPLEQPVVRFSIGAPQGMSLEPRGGVAAQALDANAPALAPNGSSIAFVATDGSGRTALFLRAFDGLDQKAIAGTEGASLPFWSPDGLFIGFFADRKLKKVDIRGGRPQTICDAPEPMGAAWNADGMILFAPKMRDGLYRVSADGGSPQQVTKLNSQRQETAHVFPSFLPDGRRFIYIVRGGDASARGVYLTSVDGEASQQLLTGVRKVSVAEPGYLLYVREGTLFAHPFDVRRGKLSKGPPLPIAEQIPVGAFSVSQAGVLAFRPGGDSRGQMLWFDRQGSQMGVVGPVIEDRPIALSPDGRRVAVIRSDAQTEGRTRDIWIVDAERGVSERFTSDPADECCPNWSPDGQAIIFSSDREGSMDLYEKPASGVAIERPLLKNDQSKSAKDWSADGRLLLFSMGSPPDLWVLPLVGKREPQRLLNTVHAESDAEFSPDGRWFAYVSDESGQHEVYVRSFLRPADKVQISTTGGFQPRWSHDGGEIYYLTVDRRLMAVAVRTTRTIEPNRPRELFRTGLATPIRNPFMTKYDVSPDGRFLFNVPVQPAESPMTVVLNWTTSLLNQ